MRFESYFTYLTDNSEKNRFIEEIFDEKAIRNNIKADYTKFHDAVYERADVWNEYLRQYLDACVKSLALNRIVVKEEQRARAIMLVLVASIFINDKYFNDVKVHNTLEAWYWGSLFGGEYDKDQGVTMISHLQAISNTLQGKRSNDWLVSLKDNVFNAQNFSDEKFLLMEKVDEDRYPKGVFRLFICQYLLSKTYTDMFDANARISVFSDLAGDLEAHHIIPLGSVSKINESTSALRKDAKNICNSPLNFVYITSSSNKAISNDSLEVYAKKLTDEYSIK